MNEQIFVSIDCRDAREDRLVPASLVREKMKNGELVFDVTNGMPCAPVNNQCPSWLTRYPRRGR